MTPVMASVNPTTMKTQREEQVLVDDGAGPPGEPDQERQTREVVGHQRDRGGMDGDVAAGGAHGDADVAGRQGRSVVDAVADDRDVHPGALHLVHDAELAVREAFGLDLGAAEFQRPRAAQRTSGRR